MAGLIKSLNITDAILSGFTVVTLSFIYYYIFIISHKAEDEEDETEDEIKEHESKEEEIKDDGSLEAGPSSKQALPTNGNKIIIIVTCF